LTDCTDHAKSFSITLKARVSRNPVFRAGPTLETSGHAAMTAILPAVLPLAVSREAGANLERRHIQTAREAPMSISTSVTLVPKMKACSLLTSC
jgi:hypothetical protein